MSDITLLGSNSEPKITSNDCLDQKLYVVGT